MRAAYHTKQFSSEHLTRSQKHFLKRLHDRFGIGSGIGLHADIVAAILSNDAARVRYVRDQPAKLPSAPRSRSLRQEWLVNIGDRYVVVIYGPSTQTIFTCFWPTSSLDAYRAKQQVINEGGLVPFTQHLNKLPKSRR